MPKFHVSKSIKINKSPAEVYQIVADFNHWTAWSPWIITEPETKVTVDAEKKTYHWEGNRTGEGNMIITAEKENESLDIDLTFLKPWKSQGKVRLLIKAYGNGSEVTWTLDSSLPFFLFWMKNMMIALLGMDYQRGLNMLKDYVEDGEVHSKLEFTGKTKFEGCNYVGLRTKTSFDKMGASMDQEFAKLMEWSNENAENLSGPPFAMYHKWEMVKGMADYTACLPVKEIPANLPNGMVSGSLPATEVNTVGHVGPYKHLGNAWSTQMSMRQNKEFKANKKMDPLEVYLNSPSDTEEKELHTLIHMPIQ